MMGDEAIIEERARRNEEAIKNCPNCNPRIHHSDFQELLDQTPRKVWKEYLDNGYSLSKAVHEEFSNL